MGVGGMVLSARWLEFVHLLLQKGSLGWAATSAASSSEDCRRAAGPGPKPQRQGAGPETHTRAPPSAHRDCEQVEDQQAQAEVDLRPCRLAGRHKLQGAGKEALGRGGGEQGTQHLAANILRQRQWAKRQPFSGLMSSIIAGRDRIRSGRSRREGPATHLWHLAPMHSCWSLIPPTTTRCHSTLSLLALEETCGPGSVGPTRRPPAIPVGPGTCRRSAASNPRRTWSRGSPSLTASCAGGGE